MADTSIKILIVDDFATMRKIIKKLLGKIGYQDVHEAENGQVALEMLKSDNFNFILADWNMPEMNGLDLLKTIRKDEKYKDIPFVLVTSEASKNNIIAAIQAGANDYIVKPFNADALQETIKKILNQLDKT
jgi:two-component system chemotaxis response regulator CheY